MIYFKSHNFEFGVNTENDHNEDLRREAVEILENAMNDMTAEQVGAIHANVKAVSAGETEEYVDEFCSLRSSAEIVSDHEDFIVTVEAY